MEARNVHERLVWFFEFLVELINDLAIARIDAVSGLHFDTVLVDIVAEHQREVASSLAADFIHGLADAILTRIAGTPVTENEDHQLLAIAKVGDIEWPGVSSRGEVPAREA